MIMNWHQRRHGWPCPDCGAFNEEGGYNCGSEECEMDRRVEEQRDLRQYILRGLIHRYRQEYRRRREPRRDGVELRSSAAVIGFGIYRVRRVVGGKLVYIQVVPPRAEYPKEMVFRVDWWRVPESVRALAVGYFDATRKR